MLYKKGNQTYTLEECQLGKLRLTDDDDFTENIWVKVSPDGKESVLQNHAVLFFPFPSWGAIIPGRSLYNGYSMYESMDLTLHPEAWESYLSGGVIDEEGNYIKELETND